MPGAVAVQQSSQGRRNAVLCQRSAQELRAAASVGAREHVLKRAHVENLLLLGAVERALDLATRPALGHIIDPLRVNSVGGMTATTPEWTRCNRPFATRSRTALAEMPSDTSWRTATVPC